MKRTISPSGHYDAHTRIDRFVPGVVIIIIVAGTRAVGKKSETTYYVNDIIIIHQTIFSGVPINPFYCARGDVVFENVIVIPRRPPSPASVRARTIRYRSIRASYVSYALPFPLLLPHLVEVTRLRARKPPQYTPPPAVYIVI